MENIQNEHISDLMAKASANEMEHSSFRRRLDALEKNSGAQTEILLTLQKLNSYLWIGPVRISLLTESHLQFPISTSMMLTEMRSLRRNMQALLQLIQLLKQQKLLPLLIGEIQNMFGLTDASQILLRDLTQQNSDTPFGAEQMICNYMEQLLIDMLRGADYSAARTTVFFFFTFLPHISSPHFFRRSPRRFKRRRF